MIAEFLLSLLFSACLLLCNELPVSLTDGTFIPMIKDDINVRRWLQQTVKNIEAVYNSTAGLDDMGDGMYDPSLA